MKSGLFHDIRGLPGGHFMHFRVRNRENMRLAQRTNSLLLLFPGVGRSVVILKNAHPRSLKIIKLPAVHRAKKNPERDKHHNDGQGYQQIKRFHQRAFRRAAGMISSRRALPTTSAELADMPSPAIQGVSKPKAAAGMASRL